MASTHLKRCLILPAAREKRIKTTVRSHFIVMGIATIKTKGTNVSEVMEKLEQGSLSEVVTVSQHLKLPSDPAIPQSFRQDGF